MDSIRGRVTWREYRADARTLSGRLQSNLNLLNMTGTEKDFFDPLLCCDRILQIQVIKLATASLVDFRPTVTLVPARDTRLHDTSILQHTEQNVLIRKVRDSVARR